VDAPEHFDWVRERDKCSLNGAFLTLREVVANNVKTINELHPELEIAIENMGAAKFVVRKKYADVAAIFDTDFDKHAVDVRPGPNVMFSAKPEICPDGECRMRVGDQLLRFWEVSKMALERLWFT